MKPRARFVNGVWWFRLEKEWPGKIVTTHHDLIDGWKFFMESRGLWRPIY